MHRELQDCSGPLLGALRWARDAQPPHAVRDAMDFRPLCQVGIAEQVPIRSREEALQRHAVLLVALRLLALQRFGHCFLQGAG
eukprot:9494222-Pyramimonas_sp.AAC.1